MKFRIFRRVACAAAVLFLAAPALAQDTAADGDATAELRAVAGFLASRPAYSFDLGITAMVNGLQGPTEARLDTSFLVEGDRNIRIISRSPDDEAVVVCDGNRTIVHFVTRNQYVENPAPSERAQVVGMIGGGPVRVGSSWTGALMHDHPGLYSGLASVADAGIAAVPGSSDGTQARHLTLTYEGFTVELYVGLGAEPLPLHADVNLLSPQGVAIPVTLEYTNWNLTPEAGPEKFAWELPEGVTKYEPRPATPLMKTDDSFLGSDAPDFTLDSLEGGKVTLSSHEGESIVLLDFWATWCGPCRMAMPVVDEVAKAFEDKGVRMYAVNLREDTARVKAFLESAGIKNVSVLLDSSGDVQRDYAASNIPRMVVIGKDGTIQAIHRGYSPALRDTLTEQLNTLLEGGRLVEAKQG